MGCVASYGPARRVPPRLEIVSHSQAVTLCTLQARFLALCSKAPWPRHTHTDTHTRTHARTACHALHTGEQRAKGKRQSASAKQAGCLARLVSSQASQPSKAVVGGGVGVALSSPSLCRRHGNAALHVCARAGHASSTTPPPPSHPRLSRHVTPRRTSSSTRQPRRASWRSVPRGRTHRGRVLPAATSE